MTTIAIIGALDDEVALIAASLNDVTHDRQAGLDVTRGTLGPNDGGPVTAVATVGGMGLVNAAATTQHLIDTYHPDAVIFSGINDVVLGGTLRYLDTDMRLVGQWKPGTEQQPVEEFHSDDRLLSLADQALSAMGVTHIIGIIASGNYFVDTPAQIAKVIHDTGADAVEMEGASVAHVAARNEVPALVIRALSDNADTDYEEFKGFDISEYADTAARIVLDILRRM